MINKNDFSEQLVYRFLFGENKGNENYHDYFLSNGVSLWYMIRYTFYYRVRKEYDSSNAQTNNTKTTKSSILSKVLILLRIFCIYVLRLFLSFFQILRTFFVKIDNVIVYTSHNNQKLYSSHKQKDVYGDHSIYYLQERMKDEKNTLFLSDYVLPSLSNDENATNTKISIYDEFTRKGLNFELFLFLNFFNPKFYLALFDLVKKLKECKRKLSEQKDEESLLFLRVLEKTRFFLFYCLYRLHATSLFYSFISCSKIVLAGEQNPSGKAFVSLAKKNNVKSIAIQHGSVFYGHIGYTIGEYDREYFDKPDVTLLWGEKWKESLISCGYLPNELKVLGQLRSDVVHELSNKKKEGNSRPVVLYASQPLREGEEEKRERILEDMILLAKENPTIDVVIKPHPREYDFTEFKEKSKGVSNIKIVKEDLYQQLSEADIVIVFFSTVGAEAIYFKKPLVVIDYYEKDILGYVKDGIGYGVCNFEALNTTVNQVLVKSCSLNQEDLKNFTKHNVGVIDGKTVLRYITFLNNL